MRELPQIATVPPGLRSWAARAQNPAMSNQWAAVAAVIRSMLESGIGGVRFWPRDSAVVTSKWIGCDVEVVPPSVRAVLIMPGDASKPYAWVKNGARSRVARPGPQPTSTRASRCPPVEVWWSMISL